MTFVPGIRKRDHQLDVSSDEEREHKKNRLETKTSTSNPLAASDAFDGINQSYQHSPMSPALSLVTLTSSLESESDLEADSESVKRTNTLVSMLKIAALLLQTDDEGSSSER